MASFGRVPDLLDDRFLNLQDVVGNVEPFPTLVPYEHYVQNIIVYRLDANHDAYMALFQEFTDRFARSPLRDSKEAWTWCVQWEVEEPTAHATGTPASKKQRVNGQFGAAQKPPVLTMMERRVLHPDLFQEETMLRILIDIVQVDHTFVPNYVEFLYQWIDYYEGGGMALKAALRMEIPSLWLYEYHPLPLYKNYLMKEEQVAQNVAAGPAGAKLQRENMQRTKPPALMEMERLTEQSERLDYKEVKFGIQRPIDPKDEPLPRLVNVPKDVKKIQKYRAACFTNRQRAWWLLQEAGITQQHVANYRRMQPMHPKATPELGNGNGLANYLKDEPYARLERIESQQFKEWRDKQREVAVSNRLAEEARIAALANPRDNALNANSPPPPALILPRPAQSGRPEALDAFLAKIKSMVRDRDPPVKTVPRPILGKLKSKIFDHATVASNLPQPMVEDSSDEAMDDDDDEDDPYDFSDPDDIDPDERDLGDDDTDGDDDGDDTMGGATARAPSSQTQSHPGPPPPPVPPQSQPGPSQTPTMPSFIQHLNREQINSLLPFLSPQARELIRRQHPAVNTLNQAPPAAPAFGGAPVGFPAPGPGHPPGPSSSGAGWHPPFPPSGPTPVPTGPPPGFPSAGLGHSAPSSSGGGPQLPSAPNGSMAMSWSNTQQQQRHMMSLQQRAQLQAQSTGQAQAQSGSVPSRTSGYAGPQLGPQLGAPPPPPSAFISYLGPQAQPSTMNARPIPGSGLPGGAPPRLDSPMASTAQASIPSPAGQAQPGADSTPSRFIPAPPPPPSAFMPSLRPQMQPNAGATGVPPQTGLQATPRAQAPAPQLDATLRAFRTPREQAARETIANMRAALAGQQSQPGASMHQDNGGNGSIQHPSVSASNNVPAITFTHPPQSGNPMQVHTGARNAAPGPPAFGHAAAPAMPLQGMLQSSARAPAPPNLTIQHNHLNLLSLPPPGAPQNSPVPITPLAMGISNKLSLNSPQAPTTHGLPIQFYLPKIVLRPGGDVSSATDCIVLGYTRPETGVFILSKAIFFPADIRENVLRRVRKGHAEVLETYVPAPNHPRFATGKATLTHQSDIKGPHKLLYDKLVQVYRLMVQCEDREEQVTKRWRATPGPMTARERGSVWEGWGLYVDRPVEMGYAERLGVGQIVHKELSGAMRMGMSEGERDRMRERDLEGLLDKEWVSDEEDDEGDDGTLVEDEDDEMVD